MSGTEKKDAKKVAAKEAGIRQQNEQLYREIKYGKLVMDRHEKQWKKMLTEIALPRMQEELYHVWALFDRTIDNKDMQISLLMDELHSAEEQYNHSMRSHLVDIDRIIMLCFDQIGELWRESAKIITDLYTAGTFERNDILTITKEHETYLKTMLYMLDISNKETQKLMRGEYLSAKEVEISKLKEIKSKFTEDLHNRFMKMWHAAEQFMDAHRNKWAQRMLKLDILYEQDAATQLLIKKQWTMIDKRSIQIRSLKDKLLMLQSTQNYQIFCLTNEAKFYHGQCRIFKGRVKSEKEVDAKYLQLLISQSREIISYLEKFAKKGEQLLTCSALCRKLETKEEKTLAFPSYEPAVVNQGVLPKDVIRSFHGNPNQDQDVSEASGTAIIPEFKYFWHHVASVEASRYKIKEQIEKYKQFNNALRNGVGEYCLSLTTAEEIELQLTC